MIINDNKKMEKIEDEILVKKNKFRFPFLKVYSIIIYVILYIPLIVVILFSFSASKSTVNFSSFTTNWYLELFKDQNLIEALFHSIQIGLIAVLIAIVIGTSGALFLKRFNFPGKGVLITLTRLPIILPGIIIGIAILLLFINLQVQLSMFTILFGHVAFTTPFVMFQVMNRLMRMGNSYEDAARDLGANPFKAFFLVTLPMIKTAIIGGGLLAFVISFDEIIITYFLSGHWSTLPVYIYGMIRFGLSPQVYAISTFILVFSVILIFLMAKFTTMKVEVEKR